MSGVLDGWNQCLIRKLQNTTRTAIHAGSPGLYNFNSNFTSRIERLVRCVEAVHDAQRSCWLITEIDPQRLRKFEAAMLHVRNVRPEELEVAVIAILAEELGA